MASIGWLLKLPPALPMDPAGSKIRSEGVVDREAERRSNRRFCCSGKAEVRSLASGITACGRIENLSLSGCLISPEHEPRFRRHEQVEMTFVVRQLPVRVQGTIRQLHGVNGIGVHFTLLSAAGRRRLQELIQELDELLPSRGIRVVRPVRREPSNRDPQTNLHLSPAAVPRIRPPNKPTSPRSGDQESCRKSKTWGVRWPLPDGEGTDDPPSFAVSRAERRSGFQPDGIGGRPGGPPRRP